MDPLSYVVSQLNARTAHFAGLRAGGAWAIRFPPPEALKFNAVVKGECCLQVDGESPVRLKAGDCFLLLESKPFTLTSDLSIEPADALPIFNAAIDGIAQYGGDELFLIGGRFDFCDEVNPFLHALPTVIVVASESEQASVLRWALHRLAYELSDQSPGSSLMMQHLGHIMLVQVLRIYLASRDDRPAGLLFALSDERVSAAIEAIHANPATPWTVSDLASVARVSRSTFALHFKAKVGVAPLEYVLRWRMYRAARMLRTSEDTVSAIAQSLGYLSDSAFSQAFKRIMSCSPREYRQRER